MFMKINIEYKTKVQRSVFHNPSINGTNIDTNIPTGVRLTYRHDIGMHDITRMIYLRVPTYVIYVNTYAKSKSGRYVYVRGSINQFRPDKPLNANILL